MSFVTKKQIKSTKPLKKNEVINQLNRFIETEKSKKSEIETPLFLRENIIKQIESIHQYLQSN